jgi:hypothetical protein
VPYAGLTAGFLATDRDASLHLSNSPSTLQHYRDFSNYGLAGMGGAVGGLYLGGKSSSATGRIFTRSDLEKFFCGPQNRSSLNWIEGLRNF